MAVRNIKTSFKEWNTVFCQGMACRANVGRDIVVIIAAVIIATAFLYSNMRANQKTAPSKTENPADSVENAGEEDQPPTMTEEEVSAEIESEIKLVDLSGWKNFENQFWGFSVKYPGDWTAPKSESKLAASQWEARYQFRKKEAGNNPYLGFNVAVYDVQKTKELSNTDEYPILRDAELRADARCQNIEGHAIEVDDFSAEEIYIPPTDDCFDQTLFFSIVKDRYIYNIAPVLKSGSNADEDVRIAIGRNFPEFYSAASTLELVDIVRPKPAPPKPKITAPKPVSFKVVGGKLVCAKKNDKPRKSRQHKGIHLDMECCLDPDEIPNPWCTY